MTVISTDAVSAGHRQILDAAASKDLHFSVSVVLLLEAFPATKQESSHKPFSFPAQKKPFNMGKKRAREADGKDAPPANNPDKMDEDSGDDEVSNEYGHSGT